MDFLPGGSGAVLPAPAKINLWLRVLGRRDDGFHDLETVFQLVDVADTVRVEALGAPGRITVSGGPPGPANLAWRAAAAWHQRAPLPWGVAITIDKRVPSGGGLGGGSSDAAAVLRALAQLAPEPLAAADLAGLALELGSDVPFFLLGGRAHGLGRGERLTPLATSPTPWPGPLHLILPDCSCSTPAVFAQLTDSERGPRPVLGAHAWEASWAAGDPACLDNGLLPAALRVRPQLATVVDWLAASGRPWGLSGSGSTFFCFGDPGPAPAGVCCLPAALVDRPA